MKTKMVFKRLLSFLTAIVMTLTVMTFAAVTSSAKSGKQGVLSYWIENGEVTITDCAWDASEWIEIPETIEGYPVTAIGGGAFKDCKRLMSVKIPDSVTSIGDYAFFGCSGLIGTFVLPDGVTSIGEDTFFGCSGLKRVVIPNGVTSIEEGAFWYCKGLTNIALPDSLTIIGKSAFEYCESLNDISLPDSVGYIGDRAFMNCESLTGIEIPDDVQRIANMSFYGCASLTSINIPNDVTEIGESAFDGCSALTSITTIPEGVTSIGKGAFVGCYALESISVDENNPNYTSVDGVLYSKDKTKLMCCPGGKKDIELFEVLNGVTDIGYCAFLGNENISCICIPDSVTNIGLNAFGSCRNINHVLYSGTEDEWNGIYIDSNNLCIFNAQCHYEADSSAINLVSKVKPTYDSEGKITYHCSICNSDFSVTLPKIENPHALDPAKNYTDLKPETWYYEAVNYALSHKLFNGTSPTTFEPDTAMTRGMLVQVLYNLEGRPESVGKESVFTDVKKDDWFAQAVIWAQENGIVYGTTNTTFSPNDKISREQLATILHRYSEQKGYDVTTTSALTAFPDADNISDYAESALKWAVGTGLISGNKIGSVNMLDARGNATRAQVVTILRSFCEKLVK